MRLTKLPNSILSWCDPRWPLSAPPFQTIETRPWNMRPIPRSRINNYRGGLMKGHTKALMLITFLVCVCWRTGWLIMLPLTAGRRNRLGGGLVTSFIKGSEKERLSLWEIVGFWRLMARKDGFTPLDGRQAHQQTSITDHRTPIKWTVTFLYTKSFYFTLLQQLWETFIFKISYVKFQQFHCSLTHYKIDTRTAIEEIGNVITWYY